MLNDLPIERVTPALRFLASESRVSQEKIAARVGMSQSAVNRRLSGDTPMTLTDVVSIAAALGHEVHVTITPAAAAGAA